MISWLLAAVGRCWPLLAAAGCCWLLLAAAGCCWLLAGRLERVLLPITAVNNQIQVKGPARGAFSALAEPEGDLGTLFKSK